MTLRTYTSPKLTELGTIAAVTARFGTSPSRDFGPRVRGSANTGSISTIPENCDTPGDENMPGCPGT